MSHIYAIISIVIFQDDPDLIISLLQELKIEHFKKYINHIYIK